MLQARSTLRPVARLVGCSRANSTLAQTLHAQDPSRPALIAPQQQVEWTYGDVSNRVGRLAGNLKRLGYGTGDVIATDLPSCAENLLLQLAASHLGAAVLTLKGPDAFAKLKDEVPARGVVAESGDSFLAASTFAAPAITVAPATGKITLSDLYEQRCGRPNPFGGDAALGYYGSAKPITQSAALAAGASAKQKLDMKEDDVVLVSITLNHLFGIGSAVSAALQSGAAIVLPDASGVTGCGSPSQRAEATRNYLASLDCTLFFADTHTLKALKAIAPADVKSLRGGVCKVGSGTTFLEETDEYCGVTLATIGKKK